MTVATISARAPSWRYTKLRMFRTLEAAIAALDPFNARPSSWRRTWN